MTSCSIRLFAGALFALSALWIVMASADVSPEMARALREFAATSETELINTAALYAPLHERAPVGGVKRTVDLAYGPDDRHRLDLYEPERRPSQSMPVLIFVHGGNFVQGDKSVAENSPLSIVYKLGYYYKNIGYFFARHNVVTIAATYRLAPQHKWPAGAEDMAALVKWARENAARFGGDPRRIVMMGHSAGATHVAAYGLTTETQPAAGGSGLAGLILVSGIYESPKDYFCRAFFPALGGRCPSGAEAYYGSDRNQFARQSIIGNLNGRYIPTMIVHAEFDSDGTQVMAALLFGGLCKRHEECPARLGLRHHNHMSQVFSINTPDQSLSAPVLDFVTRIKPVE